MCSWSRPMRQTPTHYRLPTSLEIPTTAALVILLTSGFMVAVGSLGAQGQASLAAGPSFALAGDPWEEKPYTEWTEEDARKVLEDSPWAHTVWMRVEKGPASDSWMTVDRVFTVQWASSLTVRQALLRRRQLQGHTNEKEAERFLSPLLGEYRVILRGHDLTDLVLERAIFEQRRNTIYIQPTQSNQMIGPTRMQFIRQGGRLVAANLYFPRQRDGKAVIGADEATVTFRCLPFSTGVASIITTTFDLSKMVRDGKPDL